ncbi:MAG TPA: hypothetical protein VOB72_19265 [Candidatus Dormibacteraeota bacterium]|nr:hypothetical protein [Candidatus Dormibacteraeota bacterium]
MSQAALSQLYGLGFMTLAIGFGVMRRMRPQPVRPNRLVIGGVIITLILLLSLIGTGAGIIGDPLALVLIPVFLAAGIGLGYYLVRTMSFWSDPATGALWMKGGALFALILVGTIVVRLGFRTVVYGSPFGGGAPGATRPRGFLYDLSADLLFLSLGLWASRAYFVYQRHRAHLANAQPAPSQP